MNPIRILFAMLALTSGAEAARLKELVDIEGFRTNAVVGVGLVVGLNGTGDDASALATRRPISQLLKHFGSLVDPADIKAKNVALVTVTANLPPFARPGTSIDVTVSSMGTAKSLQGGTLIATPLHGADRATYALAQGSLTVGGFIADGASGSGSKKNHVTAGRIPNGATIERETPGIMPVDCVTLLLRSPDFTTAARIAEAVNRTMGGEIAKVRDAGAVSVMISVERKTRVVELIASLEAVEAIPDGPGRVIIDERTGTIVVGAHVTIDAAAIAHGGITIKVDEQKQVVQPGALSAGKTTTVAQTNVEVKEEDGKLSPMPASSTVGDIAAALNVLGCKPRDLVSVFQALKAAGALHADLQVL